MIRLDRELRLLWDTEALGLGSEQASLGAEARRWREAGFPPTAAGLRIEGLLGLADFVRRRTSDLAALSRARR